MSLVSKKFTFAAGATIIASEHNTNFDDIINVINGNIENTNIASNAAIVATKLNLSTIAQAITFAGNNTFAGTTIADLGTVTTADFTELTSDSITIVDGSADSLEIGSSTPAPGAFTTLKVGTTNQGDILYDNGTSLVRLTPGTSGHYLKTQGAGANPTWASVAYGLKFISKTSLSASAGPTTDIAISDNTRYKVRIYGSTGLAATTGYVRFNSDSGGHYRWGNQDINSNSATWNVADTGALTDTEIDIARAGLFRANGSFMIEFDIHEHPGDANRYLINGSWHDSWDASSGTSNMGHFQGVWDNSDTVTSFEVGFFQAVTCDVLVYQVMESSFHQPR